MTRALYLGIDLGGTAIKVGITDGGADLLAHTSIATPTTGPTAVVAAMMEAARTVAERAGVSLKELRGAGVASPGGIDTQAGVVVGASNLPGFVNVPLRAMLAEALGHPAVLENDANAAAYGEFVAGAGRDEATHTLVMLTFGTGVGGGIVHNGRLVRGAHDFAGEAGHMILVPDGRPCGCGQRGCVEVYCSANATAARAAELLAESNEPSTLRQARDALDLITSADVAQHAARGDALARQVWRETCRWIGLTCVGLAHLVDPNMIVLAGGMSAAGEELLEPVRQVLRANWWHVTPLKTELALARLGNNAGIIGAAAAVKDAI